MRESLLNTFQIPVNHCNKFSQDIQNSKVQITFAFVLMLKYLFE